MGLWAILTGQRKAGIAIAPLVARGILDSSKGDDLKFLSMTSAEPDYADVARLPGADPAARASYFVSWLSICHKVGFTAFEALAHDSNGLVRCTPTRNGIKITDPAAAVKAVWPNGGDANSYDMNRLRASLSEDPSYVVRKRAMYEVRANQAA